MRYNNVNDQQRVEIGSETKARSQYTSGDNRIHRRVCDIGFAGSAHSYVVRRVARFARRVDSYAVLRRRTVYRGGHSGRRRQLRDDRLLSFLVPLRAVQRASVGRDACPLQCEQGAQTQSYQDAYRLRTAVAVDSAGRDISFAHVHGKSPNARKSVHEADDRALRVV